MLCQDDLWCRWWPRPLLIMLQQKFGTQLKNHISWQSIMSIMTPSSKSPVRNHQCPLSLPWKTGQLWSWCTSFNSRMLKFGHKFTIPYRWSMTSRMPYPQSPQSGTINVLQVHHGWGTPFHGRMLKFGTDGGNNISRLFATSIMTSSSKTWVRNQQCLPQVPHGGYELLIGLNRSLNLQKTPNPHHTPSRE